MRICGEVPGESRSRWRTAVWRPRRRGRQCTGLGPQRDGDGAGPAARTQVPAVALWQLDLACGIYLADGQECKLLSGIDDHSRYLVCAAVLAVPPARTAADAFTAAMKAYGVPVEVLTDNGKQFYRPVHQAPPGRGAVRASVP